METYHAVTPVAQPQPTTEDDIDRVPRSVSAVTDSECPGNASQRRPRAVRYPHAPSPPSMIPDSRTIVRLIQDVVHANNPHR